MKVWKRLIEWNFLTRKKIKEIFVKSCGIFFSVCFSHFYYFCRLKTKFEFKTQKNTKLAWDLYSQRFPVVWLTFLQQNKKKKLFFNDHPWPFSNFFLFRLTFFKYFSFSHRNGAQIFFIFSSSCEINKSSFSRFSTLIFTN